jgi:hypothetical protein
MMGRLRSSSVFATVCVAASAAVGSCALPDDFVKVEAAPSGGGGGDGGLGGAAGGGGAAGAGGSAAMCPPHPGDIPSDCEDSLLGERHQCCFPGRDCGPDALTNCIGGECGQYSLSDPGDISPEEGWGIVLRGGDVIFGRKQDTAGQIGRIMEVTQEPGGATVELGQDILWSPTFLTTDGAQVFWLNQFSNDLWAIDEADEPRIVATAMGAGDAGYGRLVYADNRVFFALESGGIFRAGAFDTGSMAAPIVIADAPIGVAFEPGALYYTERLNGRVLRADPDGAMTQTPEVLVEGADAGSNPGILEVYDGEVFWVTDADIRRVSTDGGPVDTLVPNEAIGCFNCITSVVVDDRYVYFATWDLGSGTGSYFRVQRYPDGANDPVNLSGVVSAPMGLTASCDRIFAVHRDGDVTTVAK